MDVSRIRSREFRVLLDANAGAGGPLGKTLLDSLQARPEVLAGFPDGAFAYPPEPLAENLTSVLPRVPAAGADLGCVLDPDSDRLAFIDEKGRCIGEELTLALAVLSRLRQERGPVVINMSSSRLTEDIARQFGVPCYRAAVGEANVVAKMRAAGALIGGEGNGGVIDPRVGWVRDPFIGMALVLQLLAETGLTLSEQVAQLATYAIVKDKHTCEVAKARASLCGHAKTLAGDQGQMRKTACGWTGRIAGCTFVRATPSRLSGSSPRRPTAEDAKKLCQDVSQLLG